MRVKFCHLLLPIALALLCAGCGYEHWGFEPQDGTNEAVAEQTSPESSGAGLQGTVQNGSEFTLVAGFYEAGIDIPAGSGDFSFLKGNGTISFKDLYEGEKTFSFGNAAAGEKVDKAPFHLGEHDIVRVEGNVEILCKFTAASYGYDGRLYDTEAAIKLTGGEYVSGQHFAPGVYTIKAFSGRGMLKNLDAMDGFEMAFGIDDGSGIFIPAIANAPLNEGMTLQVASGLVVELIPEYKGEGGYRSNTQSEEEEGTKTDESGDKGE